MSISTFSQYHASIINDLNRFGELEHIANTFKDICDISGISELARLQDESARHLGELMQSMLSNSGLNVSLDDVNRLGEEAFRTLSDQIADTVAGICKLDGISELERIQDESARHLGELMQSMMSNNGLIDLLADANRLREAALCNFQDELTLLSGTSNYFNRELVNDFNRHVSLVEVVSAGEAIIDQGLLDWLTQTRNKYFEEKSEAVDDIENVGKLTPELENDLVTLLCIFLIFSISAIALHNKGMTLEAKDLFILALSLLPTIHRLIRSTKN